MKDTFNLGKVVSVKTDHSAIDWARLSKDNVLDFRDNLKNGDWSGSNTATKLAQAKQAAVQSYSAGSSNVANPTISRISEPRAMEHSVYFDASSSSSSSTIIPNSNSMESLHEAVSPSSESISSQGTPVRTPTAVLPFGNDTTSIAEADASLSNNTTTPQSILNASARPFTPQRLSLLSSSNSFYPNPVDYLVDNHSVTLKKYPISSQYGTIGFRYYEEIKDQTLIQVTEPSGTVKTIARETQYKEIQYKKSSNKTGVSKPQIFNPILSYFKIKS